MMNNSRCRCNLLLLVMLTTTTRVVNAAFVLPQFRSAGYVSTPMPTTTTTTTPTTTTTSSISNDHQLVVQTQRNVQLALDVSNSEVVVPSLIFLAGVAGSVVYSDEALKKKLSKSKDKGEAAAVPKPVEKAERVVTTPTPAPAPALVVEEPKVTLEEPVVVEEAEEEEEEEVNPPPVTTTSSTSSSSRSFASSSRPPAKSFSDLRKEVASTVQDVRATQARIQQRAAYTAPPVPEVFEEEFEEEEEEPEPVVVLKTTPTKKRSLLRQGIRVLKKVVAPWRKWESIS